jgi:hypothetical protein
MIVKRDKKEYLCKGPTSQTLQMSLTLNYFIVKLPLEKKSFQCPFDMVVSLVVAKVVI